MMTPRDMNKATIGQSRNRDISGSKCGIRVYTFKRFGGEGPRQRCNAPNWRDRHHISRENIL